MAVSVTCRFCGATIHPPGGRAEGVTHCPWCAKDLRPEPTPPPAPAAPRPAAGPPPAASSPPRTGIPEPVVAALILAGSAVAAVGAFFAARWLVIAVG
ncbi:hypothetical protein J0H58_32105 [bacterium]|nr:hypothetical protein [bacterium]